MGCHPPSVQLGQAVSPPRTYLVLAAGSQQLSLSQPGDDGLGVPECHAGQGDAAAFLRLHVLRRRLREGGGSWGGRGRPRHPPGPTRCQPRGGTVTELGRPHASWGHPTSPHVPKRGLRNANGAQAAGTATSQGLSPPCPTAQRSWGESETLGGHPRAPAPSAPSSPVAPCAAFRPLFPSHINLLLSKHKKTPQCRSKGSFLIKEAGRITARP